MKALHFFRTNLAAQFSLMFILVAFFKPILPPYVTMFLYSVSLTLKNIFVFLLPIISFTCLFCCFLTLQKSSVFKILLFLFIVIFLSNYLSTMIAFGFSSFSLISFSSPYLNNFGIPSELTPLWHFEPKPLISNDAALLAGTVLGCIFSFSPNTLANQLGQHLKNVVNFFLGKLFVPILPFFILGFILKMEFKGEFRQIFESYFSLMFYIFLIYTIYFLILFFIAAEFNFRRCLFYIKNTIPVMLTAFSTMSSLATMPVTIDAAEKNTKNDEIVRLIIPLTVNIHTVGLAICIPVLAFSVLVNFGHDLPSLFQYSVFSFYFVLAQFAVAAMPGSGILVMIPILENHLGFTAEMSALITVMYIFFDPLETVANTLGNSVLSIIASNVKRKMS